MNLILRSPYSLHSEQRQKFSGKTLKSLIAMCCRGASWKWVEWHSDGKQYRHLAIQRRLKLPANATVWIGDATASRDRIERLTGKGVIDCTPCGSIPLQHDVTVVPRDITRAVKPSSVAAYLRAILMYYQPRRLGVIGHQPQMKAMFEGSDADQLLLSADLRERVHMWTHFGQGLDRASNQWLECDMLLILGTHRAYLSP